MKKKDVLNLVRYHCEGNDIAFRDVASGIASEFYNNGDYQLGEYIMAQLSDANTFMPQDSGDSPVFITRENCDSISLLLPEPIDEDLHGIQNAISRNMGINKFLFQGVPGTGKTESVKLLANHLERELYSVDFNAIVDSKLGQTAKNLSLLFREMEKLPHPEEAIFLFDEIDVIALDRINSHDVREMGRVTSAFLKELESADPRLVIFATTNLFNSFDKAITRRFDAVINFNRYNREDLVDLAVFNLDKLYSKYNFISRDKRLFEKILNLSSDIPYPGEMKNLLKSAVAFSSSENSYDYLSRIYKALLGRSADNPAELRSEGFTLREIERLSQIPKSTLARTLKEA